MTRDLGELLIGVLQARGVFDAPDGEQLAPSS